MLRLLMILTLISLSLLVAHQQTDIAALKRTITSQQVALHNIQDDTIRGDARSTLALKLSITTQNSILSIQKKKTVNVTAYSPQECETDNTPFHTASNRKVRHGIVAVSRDLFDQGWVFGRKIYIKSLGIFTIDDLMAGTKRNQLDIFMFDTQKALRFGRRQLEAHLLALEPIPCSEGPQEISHTQFTSSLPSDM